MGSEWLVLVAPVAILPLLALFALLIARERSRVYAICVLVPSLLLGVLNVFSVDGIEKRLIMFSIAFFFSAVVLGLAAFLVSLVVHAIKYPRGGGEDL
jgi:hypothetical protein